MIKQNRKVIVFIATSADGYIAKPNDDLSFLSIVQRDGQDYGYSDFIRSVDTVIMGRKTWDWINRQVPDFPHADKNTFIITRTQRPAIGNTKFYSGDLKELILQLRSEPGKNIFVDGGAEIIAGFLRQGLVDELIISIIPILTGSGTRLFSEGLPEREICLIDVKTYESGLVKLHYKLKENP